MLERFQRAIVWLMFASTFVVLIEPAPSDIIFMLVLVAFLWRGLTIDLATTPLLVFLLLFNIGGYLSYLQVLDEPNARMFLITSTYMAIIALFLAFYIREDTVRRFAILKNALSVAAFIAAVFGIAGYFNIGGFKGGLPEDQIYDAVFNRAVGLFKDPNVFSTYLIFPALLIIQGFMLGTQKHKIASAACLLTVLSALFISFSRGAWFSFVFSSFLMIGLTFLLTSSAAMRTRILIFSIAGLIIFALLLAMLLSIEQVRNLFAARFTLLQSYDAGETGRFGDQLRSLPLLLERPLGFGPFQYRHIFGNDPHNAYINAFASYGWLGGISYVVLIVATLVVGMKSLLVRSPWQNFAIVVYCPTVSTIVQGIQIDTDHWRHFYWLLGLTWGLFAASLAYQARTTAASLPARQMASVPDARAGLAT